MTARHPGRCDLSRAAAYVSIASFALLAAAGTAHAGVLAAGDIQTPPGSYVVGDTGGGTLDVDGGSVFVPANSVIFGFASSGTGLGSVDGPGSVVGANQIFELGKFGFGSLDMSNQGGLTSFDIFLGTEAGSAGVLNAINNGATITAGNRIMVGGAGTGQMNMVGGAINAPTASSWIGEVASGAGAGTVTMVGPGTSWTMGSSMTVGTGAGAVGTVSADFFSTIEVGSFAVIGNNTGAGTVSVFNSAAMSVGGSTLIGSGDGSEGTVNVYNGGALNAGNVAIVGSDGGTGTANLSVNGQMTAGNILVGSGADSTGAVNIVSNADLIAGNALNIGVNGGTGTVDVSGTGSSANATFANVGMSGVGALDISDNGRGSFVGAMIGRDVGSEGAVEVSGQNARLLLQGQSGTSDAFLVVGREGSGRLDVLGGGRVIIDPQAPPVGPDNAGAVLNIGGAGSSAAGIGDGAVTVSGSDGLGGRSRIVLQGNQALVNVGRQGSGELTIADGGLVRLANPDNASAVNIGRGVGSGATGLVNVDNGELQFGDRLRVGHTATGGGGVAGGTLNVINNGLVEGREVTVAAAAGATGLLNVSYGGLLRAETVQVNTGGTLAGGGGTVQGNVIVDGTLAPGNSPGIMDILGNLTLNGVALTLIELGGTAAGQYDQVNVYDNPLTGALEGTAFIDGIIDVVFYGGFTAALGDFFDIFTAENIVLGGAGFVLPGLGGGLAWETGVIGLENGREALRLLVAASDIAEVPEPASLLMLLGGLLLVRRLRRG